MFLETERGELLLMCEAIYEAPSNKSLHESPAGCSEATVWVTDYGELYALDIGYTN